MAKQRSRPEGISRRAFRKKRGVDRAEGMRIDCDTEETLGGFADAVIDCMMRHRFTLAGRPEVVGVLGSRDLWPHMLEVERDVVG